jgi:hypothetical protein
MLVISSASESGPASLVRAAEVSVTLSLPVHVLMSLDIVVLLRSSQIGEVLSVQGRAHGCGSKLLTVTPDEIVHLGASK